MINSIENNDLIFIRYKFILVLYFYIMSSILFEFKMSLGFLERLWLNFEEHPKDFIT